FGVCTIATSAQTSPTIMAIGDSITDGVDYTGSSHAGFRDPVSALLEQDGYAFTYVGVADDNPSQQLLSSGETHHNGYGGFNIEDITANLNGVADPQGGGAANLGGYWLTGGHHTGRSAVYPTYILLHIGTNSIRQQSQTVDQDYVKLVQEIHSLTPGTVILIAGIIPIANDAGFLKTITKFDKYLATLPSKYYYCKYVDMLHPFLNPDGTANASLLGPDYIHPVLAGYQVMAAQWASKLESLSAPK
ncbi:MAG TPA: SGNH/GDSL hydrolase family protein, partial [Acidobacteriaceae bacterium]